MIQIVHVHVHVYLYVHVHVYLHVHVHVHDYAVFCPHWLALVDHSNEITTSQMIHIHV